MLNVPGGCLWWRRGTRRKKRPSRAQSSPSLKVSLWPTLLRRGLTCGVPRTMSYPQMWVYLLVCRIATLMALIAALANYVPVKTYYEAIECLGCLVSLVSMSVSADLTILSFLGALICLTFCFFISLPGLNFILQGEQVFFVVTNYIETPNQRLGFCAEVRIGRTLAFSESRKVIVKK